MGMNAHELTDTDRRMIRLHCDWLRRKGASRTTVHHRRENVRRYAERLPVPLLDVTHDHADAWQSDLARRVSISTVATYTSHVVAFHRWLVETGHTDLDPTGRLPRPRVPRRAPRPVPEDQFTLAVSVAPEPIRTWLILAGFMGLRAAEIAGIRREDVVERRGRLYITGLGKGNKPYTLAVPKHVVPSLSAHLTGRPGPLWHTARSGAVSPKYVSRTTSEVLTRLDMVWTLHCFRHRFGTAMYAQTRDLLLVQQAMRHSNPNTTQLYVATADGEATAAMDRLSTTLQPQRPRRRHGPGTEAA
jgi:integrase